MFSELPFINHAGNVGKIEEYRQMPFVDWKEAPFKKVHSL